MTEKYLALIGDIIDSRHLDGREAVQQKLEQVLQGINTRFASCIKSKFLITVGDEFQGLLLPKSDSYLISITILEQMHPVKIRFGLGYGPISTSFKDTAIGMDGPAFHSARQALERLKKSKEAAMLIAGSGLEDSRLRGVNAVLSSLAVIRHFWPENFNSALPLIRQDLTQQQIAEGINLTQATVSWMLHRAKWRDVKAIEGELIKLLEDLFNNV